MQTKRSFRKVLFVVLFLILGYLLYPVNVQTVNSQETPPMLVGFSEYSRPISYDFEGTVGGYCADLVEALQNKGYKIRPIFIKLSERFKGEAIDQSSNQKVFLDAECGPSTITPDRVETLSGVAGEFSEVFAWTPYTFLIRKGANIDEEKTEYGVLGTGSKSDTTTTTTELWLRSLGVKNITPLKDRDEVFSSLINDQVDVYANDEILLMGLLVGETGASIREKYELSEQVSSPDKKFQNRYGLVIYKSKSDNKDFLNDVNTLISNEQDVIIRHTTLKRLPINNKINSFQQQWKSLGSGSSVIPPSPPTSSPTSSPTSPPTPLSTYGPQDVNNLSVMTILFLSLVVLVALFGFLVFRSSTPGIHNSNTQKTYTIKGKGNTANQGGDKNRIGKDD